MSDLRTVREAGVAIDGVHRELSIIKWVMGGMCILFAGGFYYVNDSIKAVDANVRDLQTKLVTLQAETKSDLQSIKGALKIANTDTGPDPTPVAGNPDHSSAGRASSHDGDGEVAPLPYKKPAD